MKPKRDQKLYNSDENNTELCHLETRDKLAWSDLETRAKQLKTRTISSGNKDNPLEDEKTASVSSYVMSLPRRFMDSSSTFYFDSLLFYVLGALIPSDSNSSF